MATKTVPHPAIAIAATSDALLLASSSSLHYFKPTTSKTLSAPSPEATSSNQASSILLRHVAVSQDGKYAASISDDKRLRVYEIPTDDDAAELKLLSTRLLIKKVSDVSFTPSSDILISDKVGDVYLYPLHPKPDTGKERPTPMALQSDPSLNPDATFLLGHVSVVTSHVLTPDQKFLITADRDEHIRVSHYPKSYNIERFLFGSEDFVSALHLVPSSPDTLISGGGESVLRIWDWRKGTQVGQVDIEEAVRPHRRVRSSLRRIKNPRKRGKAEEGAEKDEFYEPPEGYLLPEGQGILIKKIMSVDVGGQAVVLFFSEGCAALHSFSLPTDPSLSPEIKTLQLPRPLLSLSPLPSQPTQFLLSLDTAFGVLSQNPGPSRQPPNETTLREEQLAGLKDSLRVVEVKSSRELSDITESSSSSIVQPLQKLLSHPDNLTSTSTLSTLPLYPDLSLYPRWPGLEEDDDLAGPAAGEADSASNAATGTGTGDKIKKDYTREELEAMGVKQLGRLKAHGVDVQELLLRRKKEAKEKSKAAKRRKLEEEEGEGKGEEEGNTNAAADA